MNKILKIIIASMFIVFNVEAQVQKGDSNFGTNLGLLSQKGDDPLLTYSYTYFSLNYQYYVSKNISLGIAPAVTSTKVVDKSIIVNSTAINFFTDYSFLSSNGKTLPYLGVKYTSMTTRVKFDDINAAIGVLAGIADGITGTGTGGLGGGFSLPDEKVNIDYKRSIISLSAGIKFFLSERINLDNNFTIGKVTKEKVTYEIAGFSGSGESTDGGVFYQFTIGFGYIIGRKGT